MAPQVSQRTDPPNNVRLQLYILDSDSNKYMLPEELLSQATTCLTDGITDCAIPYIGKHLQMSLERLVEQATAKPTPAVHQSIMLEPLVLVMEMFGSVCTLGVADPALAGDWVGRDGLSQGR